MDAKLKVRQPLSRVEVSLAKDTHMAWLVEHDEIVRQELNVKQIAYNAGNSSYIEYQILPNFKKLGPRVGKQLPELKKFLANANGAQLLAELQEQGHFELPLANNTLRLAGDDIEVRLQAKGGWAAAQGKHCVVVLSTDLTPELIREGYARDIVRFIQDTRKQRDCQFTDRIKVVFAFDDAELTKAIEENHATIVSETLATELVFDPAPHSAEMQAFEVAGQTIQLGIQVVAVPSRAPAVGGQP